MLRDAADDTAYDIDIGFLSLCGVTVEISICIARLYKAPYRPEVVGVA